MVARQVWAGPGVDVLGAPSPDGRYLTFVDWSTGDLAIRDLATGDKRRLTNKGPWSASTEFALFSIVSPDTKQVAYSWFAKDGYELRTIGLDTDRPRILYSNEELVWPFDWSSDGEYILATFSKPDRTNQIVLVSVADGSARVLKTLDWRFPQKMSFSPDGRYVAYDFPPQEDSPNRDIFLLATDGTREVPLVQHAANDLGPVWAPDGKRVVFASDRTGTVDAWAIQVAEGKPQGSPQLTKRDMGRVLPMGFTQDGSYYYGARTGMQDVYIAEMDAATGTLLVPPRPVTQYLVGSNAGPEWSPDGQYLAYIRQQAFGLLKSHSIVIRFVETGEERQLPPTLADIGETLRWSPDQRSLLVTGRDNKGRPGAFLIDVNTGAVSAVAHGGPRTSVRYADWLPDGNAVIYVDSDFRAPTGPRSRIVVRDLESAQENERYVTASSLISSMAVSPDGQSLAFAGRHAGTTAPEQAAYLMVMPVVGGEPRTLLRGPQSKAFRVLAWTPDGRDVLFQKRGVTPGEHEVWRLPAQGGDPQPFAPGVKVGFNLRFHPDGQQVAFDAGEEKAEVWVLENFLPKPETEAARLEGE